jgi:hypothetical protein
MKGDDVHSRLHDNSSIGSEGIKEKEQTPRHVTVILRIMNKKAGWKLLKN